MPTCSCSRKGTLHVPQEALGHLLQLFGIEARRRDRLLLRRIPLLTALGRTILDLQRRPVYRVFAVPDRPEVLEVIRAEAVELAVQTLIGERLGFLEGRVGDRRDR